MNYVVSYLVYQPMNKEIELISYDSDTLAQVWELTVKLNELIEVVNSLIKDEEENKTKSK